MYTLSLYRILARKVHKPEASLWISVYVMWNLINHGFEIFCSSVEKEKSFLFMKIE